MAERKPLVLIGGQVQELPSGDTLPGGGGSAEYPSFTGNSGKHLAVNGTEDDVEWVDPPSGGTPGADGDSAYEVAVANGFVGDEAAWLASLVGDDGAPGTDGDDGAPGVGVPAGGTTGQMLAKVDGTDYNTEWVDAPSGGSTAMDKVVSALTTYTLTDADFNGRRILYLTASSAISLVLNTGLTGAVGPLMVFAKGTGQITVSGTATIESKGGALKSNGQHGGFSIVPDGSDTFTMSGDITT